MKLKITKLILIFIILLLSSYIVFAAQISTTNIFPQQGYSISYPLYDTHKVNTNLSLFFQLFNSSNGIQVYSSSCYLAMANPDREIFFNGVDSTPDNFGVYSFFIDSANFSKVGQYDYSITCNNTYLGGNSVALIEITADGFPRDTYHSITESIFLILCLVLSFIYLLIARCLPETDKFLNLIKYLLYGVALIIPFNAIGIVYTILGIRTSWQPIIDTIFKIHLWTFVLILFLFIAYAIIYIGRKYQQTKENGL